MFWWCPRRPLHSFGGVTTRRDHSGQSSSHFLRKALRLNPKYQNKEKGSKEKKKSLWENRCRRLRHNTDPFVSLPGEQTKRKDGEKEEVSSAFRGARGVSRLSSFSLQKRDFPDLSLDFGLSPFVNKHNFPHGKERTFLEWRRLPLPTGNLSS